MIIVNLQELSRKAVGQNNIKKTKIDSGEGYRCIDYCILSKYLTSKELCSLGNLMKYRI